MSPEALPPDVAVRCRDVHKTYLVHKRISGLIRSLILPNRPDPQVRRVDALRGLNLDIKKGEVFGILGPNGTGKSTLLACIAGISPIDKGSIETNGHVEALLQLGVGFHPHFSGRENIIIGLISMGASVEEALEAVEPVLEFAELKDFANMPFYTFSSGMKARLQFAVAVHRTPEILILDEALSAGDGFFNSKANRRIEEICRTGNTVLIVTHSVSIVESLCQRAAILNNGRVVAEGTAIEIGARYRKMISDSNVAAYSKYQLQDGERRTGDFGTGEASIIRADIEFPQGGSVAAWNKPLSLSVDLEANEPLENPRFRVEIYNAHNGVLATSFGNLCVDPMTFEPRSVSLGRLEGNIRLRFDIPALPLGGYTYFWSFALMPQKPRQKLETENYYYVHRRVMGYFQVESFPHLRRTIGRTVFAETPVNVSVETGDAAALGHRTAKA